jgi:superfamily I DNA and/or RNA helicase
MHPKISQIPRELFYDNDALKDGITEGDRKWPDPSYSKYATRAIWIDVPNSTVYRNTNQKEAEVILTEIQYFVSWVDQLEDTDKTWSIIILSFYEKQRKFIRDMIKKKFPENGNFKRETHFQIGKVHVYNYTVDKVQGREGDLVFLSMVQNERVGFMDSPNRLNVAITRARYQLVIVGDREYYAKEQNNSFELNVIANRVYPPIKRDQTIRGRY